MDFGGIMNTKEIISRLEYKLLKGSLDQTVTGICFDSRKVKSGDVFVCIRGASFDSHDALMEIDSGNPALIIVDESCDLDLSVVTSTVISTSDTRHAKAVVSAAFYGYPAEKLKMVGVTGSKGKTTVTTMIMASLREAGYRAASIGSNGVNLGDEVLEVANTTPDSDQMQKFLSIMVSKGVEYAVLECSSQGLMQHRTDMINFDVGVFLNIQHGDHVGTDEHPTFENYAYCKSLLLQQCNTGIINLDDENIDFIVKNATCNLITVGHDGVHKKTDKLGSRPDYAISEPHTKECNGFIGEEFKLSGRFNDTVFVNMPGEFVPLNGAATIATIEALGIPADAARKALSHIHINGRVDMIYRTEDLSVCIDSAHTRESTRAVLEALRAYNPKRLVCVFGAGGNRDIERRIGMGESSGKYADFSIITTEHNRFEPFETILEGVKSGLEPTGGKYMVIENRPEAIHYAITQSEPGDLVAIIGLGDDKYQHINGVNVHQDDDKCARKAIKEWEENRTK